MDNKKQLEDATKMARYLERAFSPPKFNAMFGSNYKKNEEAYRDIGEAIAQYAIATGDLSDEGLETLLEIKELMPSILHYYKTKAHQNNNMEDVVEYLEKSLETMRRNCENGFYAHVFNGAFIDSIEKHGLDIEKEYFQKQHDDMFKVLQDVLGRESPRTFTGDLFVAPLLELGSLLSFCQMSPERFSCVFLNYKSVEKTANETKEQHFKKCFDIRLGQIKEKISDDKYEMIKKTGTEMCEFYGRPQFSGIAIIPKDKVKDREKKPAPKAEIPDLKNKILEVIDNEYLEVYDNMNPKQIKQIERLRDEFCHCRETNYKLVKELCAQNPLMQKAVSPLISCAFMDAGKELVEFTQQVTDSSIAVCDGKINREDFAIAKLPTVDALTRQRLCEKEDQC